MVPWPLLAGLRPLSTARSWRLASSRTRPQQGARPAKRKLARGSVQQVQAVTTHQVVHNHFTIVQSQPGGVAEPGSSHEALVRAVEPSRVPRFHHRSRSARAQEAAAATAVAILSGSSSETPLALGSAAAGSGRSASTALVPFAGGSLTSAAPVPGEQPTLPPAVLAALAHAARANAAVNTTLSLAPAALAPAVAAAPAAQPAQELPQPVRAALAFAAAQNAAAYARADAEVLAARDSSACRARLLRQRGYAAEAAQVLADAPPRRPLALLRPHPARFRSLLTLAVPLLLL